MIAGNLPHHVKIFHEHYGEIVRVGPDELSFTDPTAWKDIYTKDFSRPYTLSVLIHEGIHPGLSSTVDSCLGRPNAKVCS